MKKALYKKKKLLSLIQYYLPFYCEMYKQFLSENCFKWNLTPFFSVKRLTFRNYIHLFEFQLNWSLRISLDVKALATTQKCTYYLVLYNIYSNFTFKRSIV